MDAPGHPEERFVTAISDRYLVTYICLVGSVPFGVMLALQDVRFVAQRSQVKERITGLSMTRHADTESKMEGCCLY
jgi:hypothetical protein